MGVLGSGQLAVRFIVRSDALQNSQSFKSWEEVVDSCQALPDDSRCRIAEVHVSEGAGASQQVEVYSGPATGVTSDTLEQGEGGG
jgi:hypothetical protein